MTDGRIWDTGEEKTMPACGHAPNDRRALCLECWHYLCGTEARLVALERENERLKGIIEQSKPREGVLPPLDWEP